MESTEIGRVLVFMEQRPLGETVVLTLNHGKFDGRLTTTSDAAIAKLHEWRPHIAVVDLDAGGETLLNDLGIDLIDDRTSIPVLGLTRRGDLKTKLAAFRAGVDDVITVPFSPEELLARALVAFRRTYGRTTDLSPVIRSGDLEIDILNREVRVNDEVMHLTSLEQSLLYYLVANQGRTITRDELLDALWGPDFISESNVVDRHVRALRVKLQNDYRKPRFIATVPGEGYRFIPVMDDNDAVNLK